MSRLIELLCERYVITNSNYEDSTARIMTIQAAEIIRAEEERGAR